MGNLWVGRARAAACVALVLVAAPLATTGVADAAEPPSTSPGTPWTWGSSSYGQLGNGITSTSPTGPAAVAGLDDVVDLHGGREHVAALTATGKVFTWGSNQEGQLGLGDSANRSRPTQVTVPCGGSQVVAVETGHNSTLALCGSGTVWAWGLNASGQLGDGTTTLRRSPVQVSGVDDGVAIAAGRDMSYVVRSNGTAWGWGDNAYGELGDGTRTDRLTPVRIGALTGVTGIAGGRDHGLALRADGSVWSFGANAYGQLGDGTTTDRLSPVQVSTGATEVVAGADHSLALRTDGQVLSWGRNYRDELGDGTTTSRSRPVLVLGLASAVSIGAGRDTGVAVTASGSVMTWGHNASGQLGDGTTISRPRAVTVPGVTGATKAAGGGSEYSVVLVGSAPAANLPPTARSTVSCSGLECTFDATGSSDSDGTLASYAWDFGDQSQGVGARMVHPFGAAGTYTATLTVTDDDGATGTTTIQVTVADAPPRSVSHRATGTFDGNTAKPVVVVPSAVVQGDQLLLFLSTNRSANATTPAGWTLLGTVADGTDLRSWVYTRTAVSGTPGSTVAVTLDAQSKADLTLLAYSGAATPTVAVGASEPATTTNHRAPSASVATGGSTVVSFWADKPSATHGWSLPSELVARSTTTGTGGGLLTAASGDAAGVAAGAWPGATATAGIASPKAIAWTVVLPPA